MLILWYSHGLKIWLHHCIYGFLTDHKMCLSFFGLVVAAFFLIIIILYNTVYTAKEMYTESVREPFEMQERLKKCMNNLENKTYKEIIARENMIYGGTMLDSITHSIPTKHCLTPAHFPEPSLFALYCPCKAPVKIGIMLWNMWHIVIIWQNQILIGHKATQAIFPDDFVILRRVS